MKINVELKAPGDVSGLESILEQWKTQFPQCKAIGACCYGSFTVTLEMPPASTVVLPQITDARSEVVE